MAEHSSDLWLGFGSFVDKPVSPYINVHSSKIDNPCRFDTSLVASVTKLVLLYTSLYGAITAVISACINQCPQKPAAPMSCSRVTFIWSPVSSSAIQNFVCGLPSLTSDYEIRCRPAHGFHHVLSMTSNMSEFTRVIKRQRISGNMDTPEGGLDAMLQAAVCQVCTHRSCRARAHGSW